MPVRFVLFAMLASSPPALADIVSDRPDAVSIALYHDDSVSTSALLHPNEDWIRNAGIAFITETRTVDLAAGPSVLRFRGVVSTIVSQTAEIVGLPAGIVEQNFDYDLLTPGSLLAKSVGETVHLVRTDPKTGKKTETAAIVRSAPNGTFLDIDGEQEALGCSGLPEKLVFEKIPEGLTDSPTLSVRTVSPVAGHYTIKLSYIATGLNWSADYVAHIAPDGRSLDLSGWLTLANFSDTGFQAIPIAVVAGHLHTTGDDQPVVPHSPAQSSQCWPTDIDWATYTPLERRLLGFSGSGGYSNSPVTAAAQNELTEDVVVTGSRVPDPRPLGDYKIYTLPEPATLAASQTKQLQFLDQRGVSFEKLYRLDVDPWSDNLSRDSDAASIVVRLKNDRESGLGKPLPAGSVSVMEPGAEGMPVFAGQGSFSDVAVGSPVEFETGRAMDVQAAYEVTAFTVTGSGDDKRTRKSIRVSAVNAKALPIRLEVRQPLVFPGAHIVSESQRHQQKPDTAAWELTVPAGGHASFDYAIEYPAR